MQAWEIIFTVLGLLGIGGTATAWFLLRPQVRKLDAEARKASVDADAVQRAAEDNHLKIAVEYLRSEVEALQSDMTDMKERFAQQNRRYRMVLEWVRNVLQWQRVFHPQIDPPMPSIPDELLDDI